MALPAYYSATTVALNGIGIGEGMARSDVNNAIRQLANDFYAFSLTVPTGTIPITQGGTGATTAVNGLAALGGLSVTYKELAQTGQSAGFTFALANSAGHTYYTGGAATATVPTNAAVAFPVGTAIVVVNNGSGILTIARASGVAMKWAASGGDADRLLASGGMCTLLKVGTDIWFVTGANLT